MHNKFSQAPFIPKPPIICLQMKKKITKAVTCFLPVFQAK